jgi:hypothetical protein
MPQGRIVLTETDKDHDLNLVPAGGMVGPQRFCGYLNWWRLGEAAQADIVRCEGELRGAPERIRAAVGDGKPIRNPGEVQRLCGISGEFLRQEPNGLKVYGMTPHELQACLEEARVSLETVTQANVIAQIDVEAEAGKTYYIRWLVTDSSGFGHGSMERVDEAAGAKEVAGLPMWGDDVIP